jgi:hypothetical protein
MMKRATRCSLLAGLESGGQYIRDASSKIFQYSETKVMRFLFSLLRIKDLYMFRALFAYLQEALHNGTWYIACVLCQLAAPIYQVPLVYHLLRMSK